MLGEKVGKPILHRLLLNEVSHIWPTYQRAALESAKSSGLVRFETIIHERAPFAEIFLAGETPHFADRSREPIVKAIAQIDALTEEVLDLLQIARMKEATTPERPAGKTTRVETSNLVAPRP